MIGYLPSPWRGRGAGGEGGEGQLMLKNAKTLRSNQTDAEQRLWYHLRAHRLMGFKFKRQKPIGRYIVDFICPERRLIIELDGGQHADQEAYDQFRDAWLRSKGYTVLRIWNNDVMQQLEGVLEQIRCTLSPTPLPQAGEQLCRKSSIFEVLEVGIPGGIGFENGIHDRKQLVHASDQSNLFGLTLFAQPMMKHTQHRIVPDRRESRHV